MKNRGSFITSSLLGAGLLAAAISLSGEQKSLAAPPPADPAHAAHVPAGTDPAVAPALVPADPAHAAHVAAAAAPSALAADTEKGDPALSQQLSQLQAKVVQLEAALANGAPTNAAAATGDAMPGMPAATPAMSKGMGKMKPAAAMPGMSAGEAPAPAMGGMNGAAASAGGEVGMGMMMPMMDKMMGMMDKMMSMGGGAMPAAVPMAGMPAGAPMPAGGMGMPMPMMEKMIGMMDKMMSMGGGAMPAAAPMAGMPAGAAMPAGGMGMPMPMMEKMMSMMDKMMSMGGGAMSAGAPIGGGSMGMMDMGMMKMGGMGGGAATLPAPEAAMSGGGGMGMMNRDDKMKMASMMGKSPMNGTATEAMPQSALPGFPGASHLYHIGATDFFLDHPQHIALTTEQQGALNSAKEQVLLAKSTADRAIQQAEQELWTLTAADQPDAAAIEAKLTAIEKLRADERLGFIRAVGEASNLLTDEQRKTLTGFAPPAPAAATPPGGMQGM